MDIFEAMGVSPNIKPPEMEDAVKYYFGDLNSKPGKDRKIVKSDVTWPSIRFVRVEEPS